MSTQSAAEALEKGLSDDMEVAGIAEFLSDVLFAKHLERAKGSNPWLSIRAARLVLRHFASSDEEEKLGIRTEQNPLKLGGLIADRGFVLAHALLISETRPFVNKCQLASAYRMLPPLRRWLLLEDESGGGGWREQGSSTTREQVLHELHRLLILLVHAYEDICASSPGLIAKLHGMTRLSKAAERESLRALESVVVASGLLFQRIAYVLSSSAGASSSVATGFAATRRSSLNVDLCLITIESFVKIMLCDDLLYACRPTIGAVMEETLLLYSEMLKSRPSFAQHYDNLEALAKLRVAVEELNKNVTAARHKLEKWSKRGGAGGDAADVDDEEGRKMDRKELQHRIEKYRGKLQKRQEQVVRFFTKLSGTEDEAYGLSGEGPCHDRAAMASVAHALRIRLVVDEDDEGGEKASKSRPSGRDDKQNNKAGDECADSDVHPLTKCDLRHAFLRHIVGSELLRNYDIMPMV